MHTGELPRHGAEKVYPRALHPGATDPVKHLSKAR